VGELSELKFQLLVKKMAIPQRQNLFCLLLVTFGSFVALTAGESEVPVLDIYRLIQYDQSDRQFGSRRAAVNMMAVPHTSTRDLSRRAVVLEFASVTEELLDELLVERSAGALFIVLPKSVDSVDADAMKKWRSVENSLINREISVPIYFTFDSDEARQLRAIIDQQSEDTQVD
jgi:hypothetical protein